MTQTNFEYVGFWARVFATIIDSIVISLALIPLPLIFGNIITIEQGEIVFHTEPLLPSIISSFALVIIFWTRRQDTPGKMIIRAKIADAETGGKPTLGQFIIRYIGYILAILPLGLGLFWVAIDPRKQGWHDKLARTIVIKSHKA